MSLRVMTTNVGNDGGPPGPDSWVLRRDGWADAVRRFDPDLIGVQAIYQHQYRFICKAFPDHFVSAAAKPFRDRPMRRANRDYMLLIARRQRFDWLTGLRTFGLSRRAGPGAETGWDAAQPQLCAWAMLHDWKTDREVIFATTKLDHRGSKSRCESAALISGELTRASAGGSAVLVGNFSCTDADEPYAVLTRDGGWVDAYRTVHTSRSDDELTFHGYAGDTRGRRMDWILHTPDLFAAHATIDRTPLANGRLPSNHYPITAELTWGVGTGGAAAG